MSNNLVSVSQNVCVSETAAGEAQQDQSKFDHSSIFNASRF